jgi:hypothetical protein
MVRKFVSDVLSNLPFKEKLPRDIVMAEVCHVIETPGVYEFHAKAKFQ